MVEHAAHTNGNGYVGQPVRAVESEHYITGRAQYVDDITLPGMWFGATVRSTIPRGRITSINFDPSIPWQEFTIVSAADIPGENTIVHLTKDHPCLAVTHVNHAEEPILLLAHPNRSALPAGCSHCDAQTPPCTAGALPRPRHAHSRCGLCQLRNMDISNTDIQTFTR